MIRPSRPRPELWVRLPLESPVEVLLVCETDADQERLVGWLRRSRVLEGLPQLLERLLDDLDDGEEAA